MTEKVLVVEDSPSFLKHVTQQLTLNGFEVIAASSYEDARQLLASDQCFLCSVLDYCLPDALNGEIIDLALEKTLRVVVLSATFREEYRDRLIQKGILDYILKDSPTWTNDLLSILRRLINNRNHHALIVDDSQLVRNHLSQLLEHQYIRTCVAEDGFIAIEKLNQNKDISFVITDHDMPNMDGLTLIREIRKIKDRNALPVIGLSGNEERTLTAQFIKAGANDFLYKPFNQEELYCRINCLLGIKEANDRLYKMANEDELTGLWNRRYFFHKANNKANTDYYIAMIDIDRFKLVNDTYGHDCGDKVIQTIANILKIYFESSCVVRFGGEEFCILYEGDFLSLNEALEAIRKKISSMKIRYMNNQIATSISIGSTRYTGTLDEKLKIADQQLYAAKQQGRNRLIHD
ncbi:GGDEF domain-containing response regulator [Vibrio salinus]|uniref:GGDEF domain-containing response regulator n=1 Tax=Vibrio salinus TaxID=2899784 RepID=UPI001E658C3D|nr:response regulator [Vibrio salinus]MCE0494357.1 response regulator [Vibrio salinus]